MVVHAITSRCVMVVFKHLASPPDEMIWFVLKHPALGGERESQGPERTELNPHFG